MDSEKKPSRRRCKTPTAERLRSWVGILAQIVSAVVLVLRYLSGR